MVQIWGESPRAGWRQKYFPLSESYLIFRISGKWWMKFAYTLSLDTANLKKNVKESIFNKSVTIFRTAVTFKTVIKKHPKRCKKYGSEKAWSFKKYCAYSHKKSAECKERDLLKEKVGSLEKTVWELMNKLIVFEDELHKIRKIKS